MMTPTCTSASPTVHPSHAIYTATTPATGILPSAASPMLAVPIRPRIGPSAHPASAAGKVVASAVASGAGALSMVLCLVLSLTRVEGARRGGRRCLRGWSAVARGRRWSPRALVHVGRQGWAKVRADVADRRSDWL